MPLLRFSFTICSQLLPQYGTIYEHNSVKLWTPAQQILCKMLLDILIEIWYTIIVPKRYRKELIKMKKIGTFIGYVLFLLSIYAFIYFSFVAIKWMIF